ncbi:MAG: hypothetical protein IJ180_05735 [Bacteroidales bacterium]|nr:hypothetical protein [Bacteroidales bacterium]
MKNYKQAVYWWKKAAKQNCQPAKDILKKIGE